MTSARANARRSLALWHRIAKSRDQRILDAYDAGLTKSEIHRLTGVSRKRDIQGLAQQARGRRRR